MYSIKRTLRPSFGAIIENFDLQSQIPTTELIESLKRDISTYRLLIFKNQNQLTAEKQVELSEELGDIESTFYKHPQSPHPDVFRVSNDSEVGCTGVGRTG
jgi:alpha-ketoglutarate-dependent taurine dioxygenase